MNYNRIKEVLQDKGITQIWLAKKSGLSKGVINQIANNKRQPSIRRLFVIAKALDVHPGKLLNDITPLNYYEKLESKVFLPNEEIKVTKYPR